MLHRRFTRLAIPAAAGAILSTLSLTARPVMADRADNLIASRDPSGQLRTFTTNNGFDLENPFFQDLGTNGRVCFTCHRPIRAGPSRPSRCATALHRNERARSDLPEQRRLELRRRGHRYARQAAGRVQPVAHARADPNRHRRPGWRRVRHRRCRRSVRMRGRTTSVSMYRRPLPSTNLRFLSAVMWDGREIIGDNHCPSGPRATGGRRDNRTCAGGATPDRSGEAGDRDFETGLFTAQAVSDDAGVVACATAQRRSGRAVARKTSSSGSTIRSDSIQRPRRSTRVPSVFRCVVDASGQRPDVARARRAIARGQEIFNTKPIVITGVAGLNNQTFPSGVTVPDPFIGTCTTCHDTPNAGNHSVKAPLNIGTDRCLAPHRRHAALHAAAHVDRRHGPDDGSRSRDGDGQVGRHREVQGAGSARAGGPGAVLPQRFAATLDEVIDFYESRFNIGLTARERADLLAFLKAL